MSLHVSATSRHPGAHTSACPGSAVLLNRHHMYLPVLRNMFDRPAQHIIFSMSDAVCMHARECGMPDHCMLDVQVLLGRG